MNSFSAMHTLPRTAAPARRSRSAPALDAESFRQPSYDSRDQPEALTLTVFVPGADAAGVEIEARGVDLVVTARKVRFVRVNWQSLHLEGAQRDYRLRLRLGRGFDYAAMQAEIHEGVLTLKLPKTAGAAGAPAIRRVA